MNYPSNCEFYYPYFTPMQIWTLSPVLPKFILQTSIYSFIKMRTHFLYLNLGLLSYRCMCSSIDFMIMYKKWQCIQECAYVGASLSDTLQYCKARILFSFGSLEHLLNVLVMLTAVSAEQLTSSVISVIRQFKSFGICIKSSMIANCNCLMPLFLYYSGLPLIWPTELIELSGRVELNEMLKN